MTSRAMPYPCGRCGYRGSTPRDNVTPPTRGENNADAELCTCVHTRLREVGTESLALRLWVQGWP